jgi:hypothetical protein
VDLLHAIAQPAAARAPGHDAAVRAGLHDEAGRFERGGDVGGAAERACLARDRRHLTRTVDAVLEAEHHRRVAEHRREERQRRRVVIRLDGVEHEIDRPDLRRVLFGPAAGHEIAERGTLDLEAMLADGGQVGAARDERHVVAGPRQLSAEIPADRARSKNGNLHVRESFAEIRFEYQYTGSPRASSPRPARDSFGRSSSVFRTKAVDRG